MNIFYRFTMFMAIFALVVPAIHSVAAQEAEAPSLAIEEIIVTARKKGRVYSGRSNGCDSYYRATS